MSERRYSSSVSSEARESEGEEMVAIMEERTSGTSWIDSIAFWMSSWRPTQMAFICDSHSAAGRVDLSGRAGLCAEGQK